MQHSQVRRVIRQRRKLQAWQEQQAQPSYDNVTWMQFISRYTIGSHIHGFYQLFWPTMRRRMRLLWALALLSALTVLIYVAYLLGERHQRHHFHTIIADSHWPIQNIAFPVIVVCNKNRLNWSRLPQIIQRYNISLAQQPLLERVLTAYDALSFARFDVFAPLKDQPLQTLNHLNFTRIATEMAWRCDELLAECRWQTESRDCCELFRPRRLPLGSCLAFNEVEQRAIVEIGSGSGLMVRLRLNEAQHAPENVELKGFMLNILEPNVWFDFPIEFFPDMDSTIGIRAVYHFYDEDTYSMHSQQRMCLQDYEHVSDNIHTLQGLKYMMENCFAECQQLYMLRYCNCTLDLFYPPSDHVACQLKDLPCLAAHNHEMESYEQPGEHSYVAHAESGLICECLHNCKSLTLINDVRKFVQRPLQRVNVSDRTSYRPENRSMLLDIYYKRFNILVYKTSLIYSWMDLIVSFGAICQLCLGCSIIGILEVLYFGLIDVPHFYWRRYALRRFG
ncbi:pickpocket protein 19 [Drosophila innubila]|uniref:pickpocket protein 19 n=1 Tax=Drosophila innubila TaxID=198719 RepID=UPI00148D0C1A|nr:pickpocket protein 19 [Drosophila innubila]